MADSVVNRLTAGPVTLDHLIALNDEIAALVRSGTSLEGGLLALGSDIPGRLGTITTGLGTKMTEGMSLTEALAASGDEIPRVYRAVVEAGIRSGRLAVALEGLSMFARGFGEARHAIGLALWYPLTVVVLAYGLFLFVITTLVPRYLAAFEGLRIPVHGQVLSVMNRLGETVWYWGPVFPAFLVMFLLAWIGSRKAAGLGAGWGNRFLRLFPWMGAMMTGFEAASFAEILALLLDHRMPYPDALILAGEASGDRTLARGSRAIAESIRRGEAPSESVRRESGFPPRLGWVLASGAGQADLVVALRQMASSYQKQARHHAEKIRVLLPTVLLLGIGMSSTLLYALAIFLPLTSLWWGLSSETP